MSELNPEDQFEPDYASVIPSQAEREEWQRQIDAAIAPHTPGAIWWDRCKSLLAALTQLEAEQDWWKALANNASDQAVIRETLHDQREAQRDTAYGLLREWDIETDGTLTPPEWLKGWHERPSNQKGRFIEWSTHYRTLQYLAELNQFKKSS